MNFNEYQKKSKKTAIYPNTGHNYIFPALGLSNESGEVAGKIKKIIRDKNSIMSEEDKLEISKELGDVLWYIAQMASEINIPLNDIAKDNLEKLKDRMKRGVIQGSGDNR